MEQTERAPGAAPSAEVQHPEAMTEPDRLQPRQAGRDKTTLFLAVALAVCLGLGSVFFILARRGHPGAVAPRPAPAPAAAAAAAAPQHALAVRDIRARPADANAVAPRPPVVTLIATFPQASAAAAAFDDLAAANPASPAAVETFGDSLLIRLPAADDAGRGRWLADLQRRTADVAVNAPHRHRGLTLYAVAPTQAAAEIVEREAHDYFAAPPRFHLIPPWSPADDRAPEQRARHDLARQTYSRILAAGNGAYATPEVQALTQRMVEAERAGDAAALAEVRARRHDLIQDVRQRAVEALMSEDPAKVDQPLVERYLALPPAPRGAAGAVGIDADAEPGPAAPAGRPRPADAERQEVLAPLMGQLASTDGKPGPAADRWSAMGGYVTRESRVVRISSVRCDDLFDAAPAMARWLAAQSCADLHYDFSPILDEEGTNDE